ncbi:MAG: hypothetical protein KDD62_05530 [Bdellovibrionales bacterium]|nr:hypothetical protein [Bdellovibrionales bacterium]
MSNESSLGKKRRLVDIGLLVYGLVALLVSHVLSVDCCHYSYPQIVCPILSFGIVSDQGLGVVQFMLKLSFYLCYIAMFIRFILRLEVSGALGLLVVVGGVFMMSSLICTYYCGDVPPSVGCSMTSPME